jgi:hypothetical protein
MIRHQVEAVQRRVTATSTSTVLVLEILIKSSHTPVATCYSDARVRRTRVVPAPPELFNEHIVLYHLLFSL